MAEERDAGRSARPRWGGWLIPSAMAIAPDTQLHASGVNGVDIASDDAASLVAVSGSMPCAT